jgi:hypothetical protein
MHSTRVVEHGALEAENPGRVVFVPLANEPGSRDVYISGGRTRPPCGGLYPEEVSRWRNAQGSCYTR